MVALNLQLSNLYLTFLVILIKYEFLFFQVQAERMQALQVLSLTFLSVLAVSAQSISSGKCPEPPVQQNFDPARVNFCLYTVKIPPEYLRLAAGC